MKEKTKTAAIVVLAAALALSLILQLTRTPEAPIVAEPAASPAPVSSQSGSAAAEEPLPDSILPEPALPGDDNISLEIERKFLVELADLPEHMYDDAQVYTIQQTYLSIEPEIRVRNINDGAAYYFAVKLPKDEQGLSRAEMDFSITQDVYERLVAMRMGDTIYKTRYQFDEGDVRVFVDVYSGPLEGLAVVEVEFGSVEEANAFEPPAWFGEDVTGDKRYKNAQLAMNGLPDPRVLEG